MAGYSANRDQIQKRLRRIEGQVRGLQRMVDEDRYCIDVLDQVTASTTISHIASPKPCSKVARPQPKR
jgi:DNA-binding FrmR family transcriptional regulator